MGMTTPWRARLHRAAALSLVLAVVPLAAATSAPSSAAAASPQSATSAAPGFGHWHRESVLSRITRNRTLAAVSCAGQPHCVAVGFREDPRGNRSAYSEVGNGRTWHVVYTAHPHLVGGLEPSGQTGYGLRDVSCWAPDRCIAVGDFFRKPGHERPLAERWNGHSWTVIHTPAPRDSAKLDHISCATRSACLAVGTTTPGDDATAAHLVERWNGSRWSTTHPPLPKGADTVTITSVSCPTATSCTVGGSTTSSGSVAPFADTLSHGVWSTDALPATAGQLLTLDCATPTACVIVATVGAGTGSPSSYSLTGHAGSWTQSSLPDPLNIASIACTSTTLCVVVGTTTDTDVDEDPTAAMARWNGTSWTAVAVTGRDVFDISCTSGTFCVLVGDDGAGQERFSEGHYGFLSYVNHSIVGERFSGAPFPKASTDVTLSGVSCPTSATCMAARDDGAIEREHARVWRISRPKHRHQTFGSVSCVSPTWCMAAGAQVSVAPFHIRSLTAVWNGRAWRTLPRSAAQRRDVILGDVSCTSRTFCLAIDERNSWAQRWNGHTWHAARRPASNGPVGSRLTSVSCTSRHFCAAVGYEPIDVDRPATVTQLWRGSHWRPEVDVRMTTSGSLDTRLDSVSCVSHTFCLAVFEGPDVAQRWNGRQWKPIQPPIDENAHAVSCASRTRCMALTVNPDDQIDIAASSWNGTSWTPRPVPGLADLEDISCVALTCNAVGLNVAVRIS
jgi:hypothetical protein